MSLVKRTKVDENNNVDNDIINNVSLFMILSELSHKQLFKMKIVNKQFYRVINKVNQSYDVISYDIIVKHSLYLSICENDKFKEWISENNDKIFKEIISYDRNIIKLLINNGADNWNDCLLLCTKDNKIDIAELCIKNGANNIDKAIMTACSSNNVKFVEKFIDNHLEKLGDYIDTACINNHYDLVKYLLTKKDYQKIDYKRCFISSLFHNNIDLIKIFEELLTEDSIIKDCNELLIEVCGNYNIDAVTYYINKYKNHITTYDILDEVFTLEFEANSSSHVLINIIKCKENDIYQIIDLLIANKATKINKCFSFACKFGLINVVNLLINKGMNDFNLGLLIAVDSYNIDICKIMIKNGANNFNKALELHFDESEVYFDIMKLLIESGANNVIQSIKKIFHIDNEIEKLFNYLINNKIINEKYILMLIIHDEEFDLYPNNEKFIWEMIYKNGMNNSSKEEWNLLLNKVKETKDHNLIKLCESHIKN
jgi:hypothetical protein